MLPDEPIHYERFQWLGKEIVDVGGEATLARVAELEGMPYAALVSLFNDTRSKDYDEVSETLTLLVKDQSARNPEAFANQLQKLKARFQEIQAIDYFQCSRGARSLDASSIDIALSRWITINDNNLRTS